MASDWVCAVCLDINWASKKVCRWGCETVNPTLPPDVDPYSPGELAPTRVAPPAIGGMSKADADDLLKTLFAWTQDPSSSSYARMVPPPHRENDRFGAPGTGLQASQRRFHGGSDFGERGGADRFVPRSNHSTTVFPGDWICEQCGDLQFARNQSCRVCGAARARERLLFGSRSGDSSSSSADQENANPNMPGNGRPPLFGAPRPQPPGVPRPPPVADPRPGSLLAKKQALFSSSASKEKSEEGATARTKSTPNVGASASKERSEETTATTGEGDKDVSSDDARQPAQARGNVETMLLEVCGALPASDLTTSSIDESASKESKSTTEEFTRDASKSSTEDIVVVDKSDKLQAKRAADKESLTKLLATIPKPSPSKNTTKRGSASVGRSRPY